LAVALVFGAVSLPVSTAPEGIPLPRTDARVLARAAAEDRVLAARAEKEGVPADVRVLGEAVRAIHMIQSSMTPVEPADIESARRKLDLAVGEVARAKNGMDLVKALRAYQLEHFLAELRAYEKGGEPTPELHALAGPFVETMISVGWITEHHVVMDEDSLRTAYKMAWNGTVGVERTPELSPSLDEVRALYTFYLTTPHLPEDARAALASFRGSSVDPEACRVADIRARVALETWRLDKVRKLGELDPAYPTQYAMGVLHFRRRQYPEALLAFRKWLEKHPGGPYATRARNYIRTVTLASADL
jgi:hypothetical protein